MSIRPEGNAARPSAIVIDGSQNALSVARCLVRLGVETYALCDRREPMRVSRGVNWIRMSDGGTPTSWERFLLGPESDYLKGSVLLACSDPAIRLIACNHQALSRKFILEECDPDIRLLLLDKFRTYEASTAAGVPTVAYKLVESFDDLQEVAERFRFPVILKPLYSPDAERVGRKFILARNKDELCERFMQPLTLGVKAVAMEFVPGGDDLLCSYYVYMDENGKPLAELTKRLLRRSPTHTGSATYHVTDWNPEAAELGRKFFEHVKLRGIGNIEFKRDQRDGQLKIIEANARFTLGDPLLVAAGVNLTQLSYARLTGAPAPAMSDYKKGLVLWLPAEDIRAYFELRAIGEITFGQWFKSILRARVVPYFMWRDPLPSVWLNTLRAVQLGGMAARYLRRSPSTDRVPQSVSKRVSP